MTADAGSITQGDYDRALLVIDTFRLVGTSRERLAQILGQELANERERNRRAVAAALRSVADEVEAKSSHAYDEDDEAYEDAARILREHADRVTGGTQ